MVKDKDDAIYWGAAALAVSLVAGAIGTWFYERRGQR